MEDLKILVERAKAGDRDAFGEIYKLYFKKIYRYCSFNLYDNSAAQDICQETFVKAWKSIKNFNTGEPNWSIQAFLFKIARNLIIDKARSKKEFSLNEFEDLESNENLYDSLEKTEKRKLIEEAISKLNDEEKQIIILRYFEEMDSKQVSKILGVKDGALRVRQYRTVQKLKTILEVINEKRN